MPVDPRKAAPRTLFEAERIKGEMRYKRLLNTVMRRITSAIKQGKTPSQIRGILTNLVNSKNFDDYCTEAARKMVTQLASGQYRSWRAAAAASSRGREIYKALTKELKGTGRGARINDLVDQNARLIKTVPQTLANKFSHLAQQRQLEGVRPEEITQELLKQAPYLTDVEARRIARTESAKASTALVQARCEDLGLKFYKWYTSNDQRVRSSHSHMDGVICAWSDPPNPERLAGQPAESGPYHPGGIYNCRCIALPVVNLTDLTFPASCHKSGKIVTVNNLNQFKKLYNLTDSQEQRRLLK